MDKALGSVDLDIPAGTQSGTKVTIEERGVPRLRASGRGDLVVEVRVEVHLVDADRAAEDDEQLDVVAEPPG